MYWLVFVQVIFVDNLPAWRSSRCNIDILYQSCNYLLTPLHPWRINCIYFMIPTELAKLFSLIAPKSTLITVRSQMIALIIHQHTRLCLWLYNQAFLVRAASISVYTCISHIGIFFNKYFVYYSMVLYFTILMVMNW